LEKFTTNLRELRFTRGLSQEELAREVGVVRQTIAYLEKGEYMPSLGLAHRLATFFDTTIDQLFHFHP
jgi:putative transcriptional regulator